MATTQQATQSGGEHVELRVDAQKNLAVSESNLLCCTIRHRSTHARVLHSWGVPGCCLGLWHIIESLRWLFSWILNYQPFARTSRQARPTENCCHSLFVSIVGMMTVLDLIAVGVMSATIAVTTIAFIVLLPSPRLLENDVAEGFGSVATVGFAFTWILGPRNSIFNIFFNLPFERAIKYHRWLGRFSFYCLCLHWLGYWLAWNDLKTFNTNAFNNSSYFAGFLSTMAAGLLVLTSFNPCRRYMFETFLKIHWVGFLVFFFTGLLHEGDVAGTIGFPFFLWCLDLAWRWYVSCNSNRRVTIHDMKLLPGNVVRIEFTKNNFIYEAGQYVFICIPSIAYTEWHPFSISSCPQDSVTSLHIRVLGDWTKKLHEFVRQKKENGGDFDDIVWIDGPYGSLTVPIHNYEHIVLISGGIGITPMQSIFNDMIHELRSGEHTVDRIHFIWTVRDPDMLEEVTGQHWSAVKRTDDGLVNRGDTRIPPWFSPNLLQVWDGRAMQSCEVITDFYVTRCDQAEKDKLAREYPSVLHFDRPNIEQILLDANTKANGRPVVVMSCGPARLVENVRQFAVKHSVDCHVEVFEF